MNYLLGITVCGVLVCALLGGMSLNPAVVEYYRDGAAFVVVAGTAVGVAGRVIARRVR
jgi:nitric oxide reductase large subunit